MVGRRRDWLSDRLSWGWWGDLAGFDPPVLATIRHADRTEGVTGIKPLN